MGYFFYVSHMLCVCMQVICVCVCFKLLWSILYICPLFFPRTLANSADSNKSETGDLPCPRVSLLSPSLPHAKDALSRDNKLIRRIAIQFTFHLIVLYFKMLDSKKNSSSLAQTMSNKWYAWTGHLSATHFGIAQAWLYSLKRKQAFWIHSSLLGGHLWMYFLKIKKKYNSTLTISKLSSLI